MMQDIAPIYPNYPWLKTVIFRGVAQSLGLISLRCLISLHIFCIAKCQLQGGGADMLSELCTEWC